MATRGEANTRQCGSENKIKYRKFWKMKCDVVRISTNPMSNRHTVLVELWRVVKLPRVVFCLWHTPAVPKQVSLWNPWQTRIKRIKLISVQRKICALRPADRGPKKSKPRTSHSFAPLPRKVGRGIITCATYKYIHVCNKVVRKLATNADSTENVVS